MDLNQEEASPADNIDKINVPVLLFHGDVDANVDVKQTRVFNRKMKRAGKDIKYIEFENESHYLRNQTYRIKFLEETGKFLEKHLK
ncbi:MAG: prolyl oligopeptidase family serine peptidase [Kordiimonadaceae bacterium]|nr:prolyl oligopeptidase family serine peptidase [Kordiimonadaceae bacterium]MBT6035926.1 prolyl oligopeptidase family serine peptidase [Kordiimonadaceae bacterium]MBT6330597.1 prolyl oligopeptidase family serine peptidase [Kordiimonadaceae bacterium]